MKEEPSRHDGRRLCRGPEVEQAVGDAPVHALQFSEVCVVPLCYRGPTPTTQKEKRDISAYEYPELVGREGLAIPCPILSPLGP